MDEIDVATLWYQPNLDVFLNKWFSSYEDAKESLARDGGFLLPYKQHYFVCEAGVISAIGLDPDDPDWEKVGWDCVEPGDEPAYLRLHDKRANALRTKQ